MGEGASKAEEPPSLDELRALWRKHDANGSAELERLEVRALLEDLRIRCGLEDPLPEDFTDHLFDEFDGDKCGTWSWHDLRLVAGDRFPAIRRRLQRLRIQKGTKHFRANRKQEQEQTWAEWAGFGSSSATPAETSAVRRELGPQVELVLHHLRVQGIQAAEGAYFFRPHLELRVERGDPHRAKLTLAAVDNLGVVAQAAGASASGATLDPTWPEPVRLAVTSGQGLYVHVLVCEATGIMSQDPLGSLVLPLSEVLEKQGAPKVQRYPWQPLALSRCEPEAFLVGQWGGERPQMALTCHVLRAEKLPKDTSLVVDVSLRSADGRCVLASARSSAAVGPNASWEEEVPLECDDEGDMTFQCQVLPRRYGMTEDAIAELATPLQQAELVARDQLMRRPLRPLGLSSPGAQVLLAFGAVEKIILIARPTGGLGLGPKEGASSFDPFVRVSVKAEDPSSGVADVPVVAQGDTETLSNCLTDPQWKEPVVLTFAMEKGLFVQIMLCSSRFMSTDELGEVVMPLEEALRLAKAPMEKRYPVRLFHQNRRHAEPVLFISFGEGGDTGTGGAGRSANAFGAPPTTASTTAPPPAAVGATAAAASVAGAGAGGSTLASVAGRPPFAGAEAAGAAVGPPIRDAAALQAPDVIRTSTYSGLRAPPELRCPPLAEFMHNHGQPVPPVLSAGSPSGSALLPAPRGPLLPEEDHATLERRAHAAGGAVRGPVPLSFFRSPLNPHAAWLRQGMPPP